MTCILLLHYYFIFYLTKSIQKSYKSKLKKKIFKSSCTILRLKTVRWFEEGLQPISDKNPGEGSLSHKARKSLQGTGGLFSSCHEMPLQHICLHNNIFLCTSQYSFVLFF